MINIEKLTKNTKDICLPLPDGVHLNKKGVNLYSNIVLKFLVKKINE